MRRLPLLALLALAALAVTSVGLTAVIAPGEGFAQSYHRSLLRLGGGAPRQIKLGLNKSMIVELPREVREVMVSNPEQIDAVIQSSTRAYLRLSYLEYVAQGPDCPDWSENLARDPQNLPWPNMGCATQKNLAAMVADPQDFLGPHPEMPRPSERRDVVWGKYVNGDVTGSKWAPGERPLSERANTSDVSESE